ncbi:PapD-like protein [Dacryopinax primogenitus]|uniref:PapD-like protein n=1 Tax=Dacryopinax primogenitus (strain DJM 731) TaxID=1858805 RepID=M5GB01_DACPD|nr:PapD-like protein [Dacryopinax primogenitus]EJU03167.1 PapD-like protein [Dacryopinax primogenitus]
MALELEPEILSFHHPLTRPLDCKLRLTNTGNTPLAFKVKTNALKRYAVRPNQGRIEPRRSREVIISMRAYEQDPPAGIICKDKFLIESVMIRPADEGDLLSELWAGAKQAPLKYDFRSQRLGVTYLPQKERWFGESFFRQFLGLLQGARRPTSKPDDAVPPVGSIRLLYGSKRSGE